MDTKLNIIEIADAVAEQLNALAHNGEKVWTRNDSFDATDGYQNAWRAQLRGPDRLILFLSNSWAAKGRLYIGGTLPEGVEHKNIPYGKVAPNITVAETRPPQQIAADILRRLLPDWRTFLEATTKRQNESDDYKRQVEETKRTVARIIGSTAQKFNTEVVYSFGATDVEVVGPNQVRFTRSTDFTTEQLRRIKDAVPELFTRKES